MDNIEWNRANVMSRFSLDGRVALVTGAGRGIGEAIASAYAAMGARLVIAELDARLAEEAAAKIRALGGKAIPITANVTKIDQVRSMVDKAMAEFGRIDILVNNVGTALGKATPLLDMPEDMWDSTITQNLKSNFLCSQAVGRVMRDQKRGNIINLASRAGREAYPRNLVYAAAKAGIMNFTIGMSVYLAPYNIRVNCISPGSIDAPGGAHLGTPQERAAKGAIPLGRIGYPSDIAFAALYLASDASDYVTGVIIDVRGGPNLGTVILKLAEESWHK